MFRDLKFPVHLELFVEEGHQWSQDAVLLLRDVVRVMPDLLRLEIWDVGHDNLLAALYGVKQVPTLVIADHRREDSGIRFIGLPTGYEFSVLIEALLDVSQNRIRLSDPSLNFIRNIEDDIMLEVFVTPT
jgi:alkyl hydroperoxide reductase subunit AhpF